MSQAKEIRTKISSIKNTQKITRAMELVAASKMRKAQDRMSTSSPYATTIRRVISHVAQSSSEVNHPYLQKPEATSRVGYIVVTSDRGLCGGLNVNLFRSLVGEMRQWHDKDTKIDLCLIGRKGAQFFKRHGGEVVAAAEHLGDAPTVQDLIGIVKVMLDRFDQGKLDRLYITSNEFINTMSQKPFIRQLLPLPEEEQEDGDSGTSHHWDYIYEPTASDELLTQLLVRYVESQVYQAVIENNACFQAAQMVAMKSASENAGELINDLQTVYNKARQASITQEIAEITAGAAAVEST